MFFRYPSFLFKKVFLFCSNCRAKSLAEDCSSSSSGLGGGFVGCAFSLRVVLMISSADFIIAGIMSLMIFGSI